MSKPLDQIIAEATGFDEGDPFVDEPQVRDYFTVVAQREMFGGDAITDQAELDGWADAVIEHRWHCEFPSPIR